jgi:hypothetical protein
VYEHADFAVCEVRALNQLGEVLATFEDAEQAIRAADELGNGYVACRRVPTGRRGEATRAFAVLEGFVCRYLMVGGGERQITESLSFTKCCWTQS